MEKGDAVDRMEKGDLTDRMSRQTGETLISSSVDGSPKEKTYVLNEKDEHDASAPPLIAPEPVPAPKRTQSAWSRLTGRTSPRSTSPVNPVSPPSPSNAIHSGSVPVRSRSLETPIYVGGENPHIIGSMDRTLSHQPAAASLFGGVSPDSIDHEEGLVPVRSREEAEQREDERQKIASDPWSVKFEPGEKINPKNWSLGYRWYLTVLGSLLVLNSTFASSAPSGIMTDLMKQFHIGTEVGVLCISLFVAGYCLGPLLWGPLSEIYGRRPIAIISFIFYVGFQIGCALAPNTAGILIFRFLSGTFAAAPLTNSGALLADIWDSDYRGTAMALFGLAPFAGPSLGPIISGFISVGGASWRWVFWVTTIFAGCCLVLITFTMPETYAPVILKKKAQRLRKETGDDRWYAPIERHKTSFKQRANDIILKPFIMLFLEPMLLAITIYMSFVYGVVYLLFEAFPFVFVKNHGFNAGENGLAFLGFFTGGVICCIGYVTFMEPRYQKQCKRVAPLMPAPELRLQLCVIASWSLVIAMFWFGWTSYASIHWISPVIAGGLLGVGVLGLYTSLFNYIVDVYLWAAASALAASTVVRSSFGAGFPLFATQMYEKLGTQWATSLLGFIALAMTPVPLLLIKFGPRLRAKSKFSPNIETA